MGPESGFATATWMLADVRDRQKRTFHDTQAMSAVTNGCHMHRGK
jgi:hypothetical protein